MRIPVAVTLESRDGLVSKDAKMVNGILEPRGDQPLMLKRPGVADVGQVWTSGTAQLLYPWNGLWAIYGDALFNGTQSTIVSPTFATWNSADKGSSVTLSNGSLTASFATSNNVLVRANTSKTVGKFYWEVTIGAVSVLEPIVGIAKSTAALTNLLGNDANGWGYYGFNGNKVNNASSTAYGATYTTGDIIGVALDCDNGTLTFYKNGVSQGQAFSSLSGTFFPAASGSTGGTEAVTVNFGATAFTYTPPSGYTAGIAALGTSLGPTSGGLRFDAQEVGASAATQLMMIKNRTQAWTIDRSGTKTLISFPSSMGAATYAVTGIIRSGTTATASLASDPGVSIGDSITVAGAGQAGYNVTANVIAITPYSFTPAVTVPLTITRSGTTATATSAGAHGLTNGVSYVISGAGQAAYNLTPAVTVTGTNTFTYTVTVTTYTAYGAGVTWNPSDKGPGITLSNGNLTAAMQGTVANRTALRATTGKSSGSATWEFTIVSDAGGPSVGIANSSMPLTLFVGGDVNSWGYFYGNGIYHSANYIAAASYTTGDVIGVVLNMNAGSVVFYKNGVPQGQYTGVTGTVYPAASSSGSSSPSTVTVNYGATAFAYSYDDPVSPATGAPVVTRPAVTVNAAVSYTVAGSPATPATGTITLTTNGGMVPGLPYIDGYFFVMDQNGVMWQSSIDAPGTFPALSNLTAQSENGKGKALARSLNYLIAFKEWDCEFFYNAKQQNFSFLPVDNGFTEVGCATGDSVAHIDGNLAWLSQVKERGRSVHLMSGLQQQKISTADVERILNLDDLATVYAYGIKLGGHSLYLLTLVTSNITLVYDLSSQAWSQWTSLTLGASKSVTSITRDGTTATVTTSTAHGLNDGDPTKIAGATQNEYNGIFQISYVSATVFTIQVTGVPPTATGTITASPYTSSYFKFTKYCDFQGANLFLHETDGHLYQMLPTLYQDAGVPIDRMFRTTRLDGGTVNNKRLGEIVVVGDAIDDTMMLRWSDDDCATFSVMRRVDLSLDRPSLRRGGKFRRRTFEGRHIGNANPRFEAIELEIA